MTLDECIAYFEEQSKEHTKLVPYDVDEQYNKNCRQLAEWLKELKAYREARKEINGLATVWEEGEGINPVRYINYYLHQRLPPQDA